MERQEITRRRILKIIKGLKQSIEALEGEKEERSQPLIATLKERRRKWEVLLEATLPNQN